MAARGRPRGFDREAALVAAMKVFWQQGYSATSMADLYAAMGINSPSLYAAFGSKEDLYLDAIAHYEHCVAPQIWSPLETALNAREGVRLWLKCSAQMLTREDFPLGCMVTLSTVASEGNERLGAVVIRARQQGIKLLCARLEQAAVDGELPAGIDTQTLARLYVGIQHGLSIQARDGAGFATLDAVAEMAMALWPVGR